MLLFINRKKSILDIISYRGKNEKLVILIFLNNLYNFFLTIDLSDKVRSRSGAARSPSVKYEEDIIKEMIRLREKDYDDYC
jgi:hypothetical protein